MGDACAKMRLNRANRKSAQMSPKMARQLGKRMSMQIDPSRLLQCEAKDHEMHLTPSQSKACLSTSLRASLVNNEKRPLVKHGS